MTRKKFSTRSLKNIDTHFWVLKFIISNRLKSVAAKKIFKDLWWIFFIKLHPKIIYLTKYSSYARISSGFLMNVKLHGIAQNHHQKIRRSEQYTVYPINNNLCTHKAVESKLF